MGLDHLALRNLPPGLLVVDDHPRFRPIGMIPSRRLIGLLPGAWDMPDIFSARSLP